jgi:hypothetical protein
MLMSEAASKAIAPAFVEQGARPDAEIVEL